jgi:alanine racemase
MTGVHSYLTEDDKNHLGRLEVSAAAVRHNIGFFRQMLRKETGIMLVVKASAYGTGSIEIAQLVETENLVEYLAVADVDEGIELRKAGVKLPILILNPARSAFAEMIEHCLEPELHHISLLLDFEAFLLSSKLQDGNYPVHLKLNTGMNRLGFDKGDMEQLKTLIKGARGWEVRSVMTHLSSSGDKAEDDFSNRQLTEFEQGIKELRPIIPSKAWFHALNTDGIFRFPMHHYQMVRLGIGLYGASSLPEIKSQLKGICRFTCRVSQCRKVAANSSIGYGRKGRTTKSTNIATLAIGYADGFNRALGEGNWKVEINGKLYPTIGSICMDICMVELGEDWYEPQTEVILFGGQKSIHDYAEAMGTITYEALTSISARVKRVLTE